MKTITKYILGAILLAGGVVGTFWFYPENVDHPATQEVQLEKDVADKVVLVADKRLRMVGLPDKEALVEVTDVGRFVIYGVEEVTSEAMCNVLFWGQPTRDKETQRIVPVIPEFSDLYQIATPVALGICDPVTKGNCLWNCLFKGADCLKVADSKYYLASDTAEFLQAESQWKARGLQMRNSDDTITAFNEKGGTEAVELLMTHSWAGLDDLNFQPAFKVCDDEDGQKCSFKKKLRYNPNNYVNAKNSEEGKGAWAKKLEEQKKASEGVKDVATDPKAIETEPKTL